jgi:hypothetical protein
VLNDTMLVVWKPRHDLQRHEQGLDLGLLDRLSDRAQGPARPRRAGRGAGGRSPRLARARAGAASLRREARAALARALDSLSHEQRSVLVLTYFHDLPYAEIALIVGCPVDTVKTRCLPRPPPAAGAALGRTGGLAVKARVLHLDSDPHLAAQILLPWYANATLDAEERVRFEAHLGECPRCQADVEFQRRLQAVPAGRSADAADRGWLALRARLEAKPAADTPRATGARGCVVRWLPLALGLQWCSCCSWPPPGWRAAAAEYRTLGAAAGAAAANALVVFRPTPPRVPSARRCAPPTPRSSAARP